MREIWFMLASVFTMGCIGSSDERIRVVLFCIAVLFWGTFIFTERYGRLNADNTQSKDA